MTDEELKKLIEEVIGNNDPFWNQPVFIAVKKILNMPFNTQTNIDEILKDTMFTNLGEKQQEDINQSIYNVCKRLNISLEQDIDIHNLESKPKVWTFKKIAMNKDNNKFVYQDGEIELKDNQCDLCKFNNITYTKTCKKFPFEKPFEITSKKENCPFLELK